MKKNRTNSVTITLADAKVITNLLLEGPPSEASARIITHLQCEVMKADAEREKHELRVETQRRIEEAQKKAESRRRNARRNVLRIAKRDGLTVNDKTWPGDRSGEIEIDAPKGHRFTESDCHYHFAQFDSRFSDCTKAHAWEDLLGRIESGLTKCEPGDRCGCEIGG